MSDVPVQLVVAAFQEEKAAKAALKELKRARRLGLIKIENAAVIRAMRDSHGGFAAWLGAHHPLGKEEWVRLFRKTFRFTGGEITGEFLMSIGYLPSPHREDCPVYAEIAKLRPPWMNVEASFWT